MTKTEGAKSKRVSFRVKAEPGSKVFVAGSFNQWNTQRHPLRDGAGTGLFTTSLTLPPGLHEYKFIINGDWQVDPDCRRWVQNRYGTLNNVIAV
jgi:1,4-alpha-glucan branching enzyme